MRFNPFWKDRAEVVVDDELESHIELQTHRYVEMGMPESEARAKAVARFGNADDVRRECSTIQQRMETRVRRTEYLDELRQDVKFTFRSLSKSRLFTVVSLLTIAIGVGANTAIFSVIDAVLVQPPPYAHASQTMVIGNATASDLSVPGAVSAPEFFDYATRLQSVDAVAALRPRVATLVGNGGEAEALNAYVVSPNLFQLLGVGAAHGRTFRHGDGIPGGELSVVLSDALWQRRFGADPTIVGRSITINTLPHVVVGVMPPGVRFPDEPVGYLKSKADVWISATFANVNTPQNRGNQNLVVLARRKPASTEAMVARDAEMLAQQFRNELPERYGNDVGKWKIASASLRDTTVGAVRPMLLLFGGAVGLVLLIACVNVANLMIARGALRQREFAVRLALGAGRGRLLRQLMTESVLLSVGGGVIGIAFAIAAVKILVRLQPGNIPRLDNANVNVQALLFAVGLSVTIGLVIGLLPAFQQSAAGVATAIRDGGRGASDGRARRTTRAALVVFEVAMALILLNGAGLLGKSFVRLQEVDPGFDAGNAMTMYVSLPRAKYDSAFKVVNFHEQLQNKLERIPGATRASGIYPLPMAGEGWSGSFEIEGVVHTPGEDGPHAQFATTMPGYFAAMGITLVAGRDFTERDRFGQEMVAIIDEDLAAKFWQGEDPIGKRIAADAADGTYETVVGVVRHVRSANHAETGEGHLYLPYMQHPQGMIYSVVRTAAGPNMLMNQMRDAVRSLDQDVPVSKVQSVDELLSKSLARPRFNVMMIGALATVALILASIGLYGVMSYLVQQRAREIGIRMALGGQPAHVRWMVVRESLTIALIGVGVGTVASVALSGAVSGMLYGVNPTDVFTFGSVALFLLVVAVVASIGPVRRATGVAPLEVLRDG